MCTFSLGGHLEQNRSLVFYWCPSAELTGRHGVVMAMYRLLDCQCFCVWCVNWDPEPRVSSCATAEDIPFGFSASVSSNVPSHALVHFQQMYVYYFVPQSALTSFPLVQFFFFTCTALETFPQKWQQCLWMKIESSVIMLLFSFRGWCDKGCRQHRNDKRKIC